MAPPAKVTISARYCKGCRLCIDVCPKKALRLTGKLTSGGIEIVEWDETKGCTACLRCTVMCPDAAITVEVEAEPASKPK
ncbi:MAG TPA: 4Fe-4S dicluster domain-containing protein [Planctomycetota bacterium]|nr:4Fe-4S dicluster domain-containing protein [Planctomycetota bacterium]